MHRHIHTVVLFGLEYVHVEQMLMLLSYLFFSFLKDKGIEITAMLKEQMVKVFSLFFNEGICHNSHMFLFANSSNNCGWLIDGCIWLV